MKKNNIILKCEDFVNYLSLKEKAKVLGTPKFRKRNLEKAFRLLGKIEVECEYSPIVSLGFPVHKVFLKNYSVRRV